MVITWSNLVTRHPDTGAYRMLTPDLLAEAHLAPVNPEMDWEGALSHPDAPWSASIIAAARPVRQAIEQAFRDLVLATPDGRLDRIDEAALPDGRARRHLHSLLVLGIDLGGLPEDLAVVRHVLEGAASLEPLPMCPPPEAGFDSVLEEALHAQLCAVHGMAPAQQGLPTSAGLKGTALRHVQDALTDTGAARVPADDSVRFFGVRDMGEEADLAASIARKLIDTGCPPHEIAVMLPGATYGANLFLSSFEAAGIPLSGVPNPAERDTSGETLWLLLSALRQPPPAMLLASLCLSSDMPWPKEHGRKMARSLMDYGKRDVLPDWLTDGLRQEPRSFKALMGRLWGLARHLPRLKDRIGRVAALVPADENTSPDWEGLLEATRPEAATSQAGERFVEAASLWLGDAEPWRAAKHLIVVGFAGNAYPRGAGVGPVFLDSELKQLQDSCGLEMPTRAKRMGATSLSRASRHRAKSFEVKEEIGMVAIGSLQNRFIRATSHSSPRLRGLTSVAYLFKTSPNGVKLTSGSEFNIRYSCWTAQIFAAALVSKTLVLRLPCRATKARHFPSVRFSILAMCNPMCKLCVVECQKMAHRGGKSLFQSTIIYKKSLFV
jgi:hypothetical protein